jgi:hypothetical protein
MDDLTPVKGPTSPFEGRSAKVIAVIVIGILVAIIKPWGTTTPVPLARATAAPTAVAATPRAGSPTPFDAFAGYDHELFGIYEPEPRWELWPAGYLVSFGYAIRIGSTGTETSPPSTAPGASASPDRPVASPADTPTPPAKPGAQEPNWPATITITDGNHLGLIGVNTPLGYKVTSIGIARVRPDGADQPLQVVTPESQWPDHFTVIGLAEGTGHETIENWPAGQYRLDLSFEPGPIDRSISIVVSASSPADGQAGSSPSDPPASPSPYAP